MLGVYSYREYSFDNGDPILTNDNGDGDEDGNAYSFSTGPEVSWVNQYRHRRSGCLWLLHRTALSKMLLVLSVGLIIAALITCCLSTYSSEDRNVNEKKVPPISVFKTNIPLFTKKAPYDVGSESKKVQLGSYSPAQEKITML